MTDTIIPGRPAVYVHMSWKTILMILAVLVTGGGSLTAFRFVTEKEVDKKIETHSTETNKTTEQLRTIIEQNTESNVRQDQMIGEVTFKLNAFQSVQHKTFARDEARRLTDEIDGRRDRERTYDRLVDVNEARLKVGKDPCRNISCTQ